MTPLVPLPPDYAAWLAELKSRIATAQLRATLAVNSELIRLYWEIGHGILDKQQEHGWGTKVIDTLAKDLRSAFPDMKGFSPTNLKYMRRFAEECPERSFGQQAADQLPWFHVVVLLTRLSGADGPSRPNSRVACPRLNNWKPNYRATCKRPTQTPEHSKP